MSLYPVLLSFKTLSNIQSDKSVLSHILSNYFRYVLPFICNPPHMELLMQYLPQFPVSLVDG